MNVTQFWQWGSQQQYEETVIEITTTQPNQTFEWERVYGDVRYYDWDNGVRTNNKSHTFPKAGTYTIKIVGNIDSFKINKKHQQNPLITKIIQVANTINSFSDCFAGCTNLTSIPAGLFDKNISVVSFWSCFADCTNLTSIPAGLFDKNISAISFISCFAGCSNLTAIPAGLFDKNTNVTNFDSCFYSCSKLTTIPTGLFDKNINAVSLSNCFNYCFNLTTVPEVLFDKNIKVHDFSACFFGCYNLINRPKPYGLEMWEISGKNGRPLNIQTHRMFRYCKAMPDYNSLPYSVK
ncbi:hypothetical protein ACILDT_09825 [Capnocytophaga canis]|uniref:hypothetical protein n=1 Tax=Capnocytophaga canis TaxID=1848903 RepID=UPI0037D7103B